MRRPADILISLLLLVLFLPLMLTIALAIVVTSKGSPLYGGRRVGLRGRIFRMWKFRTMVTGADRLGPSITGNKDPRITPIGAALRKTKLDELPQFLNVLTGDMTLVGPRPEAPDMVARYTERQRAVLEVKPGVTGRVQLDSGEESESIPQGVAADEYYVKQIMNRKLEGDLEYLRKRTPLSDLLIVIETVGLVFTALVQR